MTKDEALDLALKAFESIPEEVEGYLPELCTDAVIAIKQARSAPVQEPVAYDKTELNCFAQDLYDQKMREGKRGHYESMFHVIHQCVKKVAPPPAAQRQWVGLTDNEIDNTYETQVWDARRSYARAIEAKLKEKNT
jgi:hypothetical protein